MKSPASPKNLNNANITSPIGTKKITSDSDPPLSELSSKNDIKISQMLKNISTPSHNKNSLSIILKPLPQNNSKSKKLCSPSEPQKALISVPSVKPPKSLQSFQSKISPYVKSGLLIQNHHSISTSKKGLLVLDWLVSKLI